VDIAKPVVVMGIGLPGSGKSQWLERFARDSHAVYLNTEVIREELNGDAGSQNRMNEVWRILYGATTTALTAGQGVVIDATNYKRRDRLQLIRHCRQHASEIVGLWFVTPVVICERRNLARNRVVPPHAMRRMERFFRLEPPTEAEGFDQLLQLDTTSPSERV